VVAQDVKLIGIGQRQFELVHGSFDGREPGLDLLAMGWFLSGPNPSPSDLRVLRALCVNQLASSVLGSRSARARLDGVAPASQPSDQPDDGQGQPQAALARAATVGTTARVSRGRGFSGRAASRTTLAGGHWAYQRRGHSAGWGGRATSARTAVRAILSGRRWDQQIRGRAAGPSRSDDDGDPAASSARAAGIVGFANADRAGTRRAPTGRTD
jgi:hypothetical protein